MRIAKEFRDAQNKGDKLGLSEDEGPSTTLSPTTKVPSKSWETPNLRSSTKNC